MPPRTITEFAPAKINLALHVVGQRPDGYHLLDSLVAFASVGDRLTLTDAGPHSLTVSGPEATAVPQDDSNLVLRVAARFWTKGPLHIHLEKNLPVASGIGGGSADAAACFRGMMRLLDQQDPDSDRALLTPDSMAQLLRLGADIPMCLIGDPAHVSGIGETILPLDDFPHLPVVLVNPRVPVATPDVFRNLSQRDNAAMDPLPAELSDVAALIGWLARQRNDLQDAAMRLAPVIGTVLEALGATPGCRLARMSGSGATCFGVYDSVGQAETAAESLHHARPDWWIAPAVLDGQTRIGGQT